MSDVTIGVKVSEETKEKVTAMIEASGLNSKEWFESLLSLYHMEQLKQGTVDYAKDLGELEIHTNRIVHLVGNMVQRATHEKEAVQQQLDGIKASKDEIISSYQLELAETKKQMQQYADQAKQATKEREVMDKHIRQLEEAAEHHRDLIGQYKEKIDTLTGLVNEYKGYSEENKALQSQIRSLQQQAQEQASQLAQYDKDIATAVDRMQKLEAKHKDEMERQAEWLTVVKEREVLQLRGEFQERIARLSEDYTAKIQALYAEINELRKQSNHVL